ncbi:molybdopterin-dependent oxidoreductase [Saccharopolyspora spinosa]|uniref:DMSO/TMAO reductase YedYZ molybdopterin-dependent catalytic subunit n=1 Tax=Saccharopolyspora spinosa TaxID=60894 RepID=A0A2N3XV78_SACSN|nr:molybdopterin-dependent oxidoreductase [Saccharopolyspora spinosa]PKW14598.1 DMSO/TMAO reductase YedYZ molybdopterin-dependent catalytic subunit [Saccharopolyspora spinosa]
MSSKPLGRAVAILISVLAVCAALGAGHLVAAVVEPNASPYLAVGNTAIDLTPEPIKAFAIRTFGEADKMVLLLGMSVVIAGLAVFGGLVSQRSAWPGLVLFAVFGGLGIAATIARPDLGASAIAAPAVSAAAGTAVFARLHVVARRSGEGTADGRRRFLIAGGAVAAGSALAGIGGMLAGARDGVEASRSAVTIKPPPPIPAGADFAKLGTPSFRTPNRDFYRVDTALRVPRLRSEDWRLRVHGMVGRELTLTFDDLLRRRRVARTITMTCVSNEVGGPYVSTAHFVGVPIRDVLLEAGVQAGAEQVFSTSVDGYTAGTPVDVLLAPERYALLAYGMNGEPLPAEHGFPVRMVTPGLYGYVSATKWLTDLELTTFGRETYWERRGWAERAPIKTQSRIDRPRGFARIPAGRTTVAGTAWAQTIGIDRVEVRVDGGAWQPARLSTEVNLDTWRMWYADLDLAPGGHRIECRATDRNGYTQTPERVPTVPDGATGWHSVFCTAR